MAGSENDVRGHREILLKKKLKKGWLGTKFNLGANVEVYLHGFYFITPEQQLFFKLLERSGVKIKFFQYYDPRFPNTFDFIRSFISEEYGWSSDWRISDDQMTLEKDGIAELFLTAYEERKSKKIDSEKNILKYNSFFDFLQDIIIPNYPLEITQKANPNLPIFATNADELNEMLQVYYPAIDAKNRSFLSHPLGQFLINIHKIYDGGEMCLTSDLLVELFASGWLVDERNGAKAKEYTYDLQQILPYFEGCKSLDSWQERIKQLVSQKEMIHHNFPANTSARKNRSIRSPFEKLSYFSINQERIAQIKTFIDGIRILAEDLFIPTQSSNHMDNHFKRLMKMMMHRKKVSQFTDVIEVKLLDDLIQRVSTITDSAEFLYKDIQPALSLYLNGKFDPEGVKEDSIITSFLEFDGEIFKNHDNKCYFTGLDERSLPLGEVEMPWPLQEKTFEQLSNRHLPLQLHLNRNITVKEASRFLFFIALKFIPQDKLEISWIANILERQNMHSALYVRQLRMKEIPYMTKQTEVHNISSKIIDDEVDMEMLEVAWESINSEGMLAEYNQCPKRFYYSYIVDEFPTFQDDFHHGFIFSQIYLLASSVENRTVEGVLDEVSPLFPQWLDYKKSAMAYDTHGVKQRFLQENTNEKIVRLKYSHYFPGSTDNAREKFFNFNAARIRAELLQLEPKEITSNPGFECRFCPHRNYCTDVKYSIDR